MAYAIYRQLKIKSLSHLVRATRHNERKQEVSNADPNCRQQNVVEASDDPIVSAWKEKVGAASHKLLKI